MSKLVINPLVSGFPSVATLNANFEAIEAALENTVSRDGTTPNHLTADLDMNGHRILNAVAQEGEGFVWRDSWTTATSYEANNLIKYNGDVYICVTAHTSGTWATDLAAGKWTLLVEKPTAIGGGDLLAANNLDDVDDFNVARANILAAKSGSNNDITSLSALASIPTVIQEVVRTNNYFHNPEMSVQQRPAVTPSNTRQIGQVDRWAYQASNASFTATASSLSGVTVNNRQVLNATVQFTAANAHIFDQRLPAKDCWKFGDKAIIASAYVFQNSGSSQSWYWEINGANSVNNFSAKTTHATGSASPVTIPTGVWTMVTFTTTLTNSQVANGLEFRIKSANSAGALASHNVRLKDCQLEFGSTSTTFSSRSYEEELDTCIKYWETSYASGQTVGTASNTGRLCYVDPLNGGNVNIQFKAEKIKPPAVTCYSSQTGAINSYWDASSLVDRTPSILEVSESRCRMTFVAAGVDHNLTWHYVADAEL